MTRALIVLAAISLHAAVPDPRAITITRDTWGVPHIQAPTDAGTAYGIMYAQAEDNFTQLESDYIRVLGHAAEVDGARGLPNDVLIQAWQVEARARAAYAAANPKLRDLCDAFAAGVNRYLATHPGVHPRLLTNWEPWWILAMEMGGPAGPGITPAERAAAFPVLAGATAPTDPGPEPDEGSNMWAVSPARSASKHALLLINPHVGFYGGGQRYEAHLQSREGLNVSGFAILGTPYIRSGHNPYLGWSHTNNYAATADTYSDPLEPAESWTASIRVRTPAGIETRTVTFRKNAHGPILGIRDGRALAVRAVAPNGGAMEQRWAMARARNLREFQAALARTALTGSNTIYADRAGNIWYLHGNAIPRRDAAGEWHGLHPLAELPQILNPKSGWLQNCNSTFYNTSAPEDTPKPGTYPAYMTPEPDTERSKRSRAILAGSNRFTFEQWTALAMDTRVGLAAARIPEILKLPHPPALDPLIAELQNWDQIARVDSVAATLFIRTATAADPIAALTALKSKLESDFGTWRVPWGDLNRLQRVHTSGTEENFSDAKPSFPVPGAPSATGTIFTFGSREVPNQKRLYGTVGDTYVAVVRFAKPPQTFSLLVYGQSADPTSPHHTDQAPLYSQGKFKSAYFTKSEIARHKERSYRP